MHSNLFSEIVRRRAEEIEWSARRPRPHAGAGAGHDERRPASTAAVTVRWAAPDDAPEIARLTELDSASASPRSPLLIGERDGTALAALSLRDGSVVANPYAATADIIALLRLRAQQVQAGKRATGPRRLPAALLRRAAS